MKSYEDLKKTDLFSFFNFTEMGRRLSQGGLVEIRLKPGAFQEFIDASMKVDRAGNLQEGILYLDRDWIGGPMTLNPFGKDLAKSFVNAVTHPDDRERAAGIVSTLWRVTGSDDIVLRIRDHPETGEKVQEFLEKLVNVYLGTEDSFSMDLSKTSICIENIKTLGKSRLRVVVSARS
jgi:hypothetical protein